LKDLVAPLPGLSLCHFIIVKNEMDNIGKTNIIS